MEQLHRIIGDYLQQHLSDAVYDVIDEIEGNQERRWKPKTKQAKAVASCKDSYIRLLQSSADTAAAIYKLESPNISSSIFTVTKQQENNLQEIGTFYLMSPEKIEWKLRDIFRKLNQEIVPQIVSEFENLVKDRQRERRALRQQLFIAAGIVMLAVLVGVMMSYRFYSAPVVIEEGSDEWACRQQLKAKVETMKETFTSQSGRFWKVINRIATPHVCKHPSQLKAPLSLFAVTFTNDSLRTTDCVVNALGTVIGGNDVVSIDLSSYTAGNSAKELLHDDIQQHLVHRKRVIVLKHVDKLPFEVAKLFFKFCDSEGTEHPEVVFVFTLNLQKYVEETASAVVIDEITTDYLESVWNTTDLGQVRALVARITDVVVQLFDEHLLLKSGKC